MIKVTEGDVSNLTAYATQRLRDITFAGFLVQEDDQNYYIADIQGTWIVRRDDVSGIGEWDPTAAPKDMQNLGRAVTVSVREGAIIHELRPWRMERGPMGSDARAVMENVFTLGGADVPVSQHTLISESRLADLERAFARRLGWNPDSTLRNSGITPYQRTETYSKTIELYDGYSDVDAPW